MELDVAEVDSAEVDDAEVSEHVMIEDDADEGRADRDDPLEPPPAIVPQSGALPPRLTFDLPNKVGRPPLPKVSRHKKDGKFNDGTTRDRVLAARGTGATGETCARFARISPNTLWSWLSRGEQAGPSAEDMELDYYEFYVDYGQANANLELGFVTDLIKIARGQDEHGEVSQEKKAQVLQWCLEHFYPDKYGKRLTIEGSVDHRHRLEYEQSSASVVDVRSFEGMSDDKLDDMIKTTRQLEAGKLGRTESAEVTDAEVVEA